MDFKQNLIIQDILYGAKTGHFHTLQNGKNASLHIFTHCPTKGIPTSVRQENSALTILTIPIAHPAVRNHISDIIGLSGIRATFLPNGL